MTLLLLLLKNSVVADRVVSRTCAPRFKSQFHRLMAVWPLVIYLTSLASVSTPANREDGDPFLLGFLLNEFT